MYAGELAALRPVRSGMAPLATSPNVARSRWRVRPALLVALGLSLLLHAGWSLWPVDPAVVSEEPVLTATLVDMPPPPTAVPEPPATSATTKPARVRPRARRAPHPRVITAPSASEAPQATVSPPSDAVTDVAVSATTSRESNASSATSEAAIGPPATMAPPVE